jgi:hypothetical protein
VHDITLVGVGQCIDQGEAVGVGEVVPPEVFRRWQDVAQPLLHPGEHQVESVLGFVLAVVEQRDDVGVGQPLQRFDLALEEHPVCFVGVGSRDQFHRDQGSRPLVDGFDDSGGAIATLLLIRHDYVPVRHRLHHGLSFAGAPTERYNLRPVLLLQ